MIFRVVYLLYIYSLTRRILVWQYLTKMCISLCGCIWILSGRLGAIFQGLVAVMYDVRLCCLYGLPALCSWSFESSFSMFCLLCIFWRSIYTSFLSYGYLNVTILWNLAKTIFFLFQFCCFLSLFCTLPGAFRLNFVITFLKCFLLCTLWSLFMFLFSFETWQGRNLSPSTTVNNISSRNSIISGAPIRSIWEAWIINLRAKPTNSFVRFFWLNKFRLSVHTCKDIHC